MSCVRRNREEVLGVDESQDLVEIPAVDGQTRVSTRHRQTLDLRNRRRCAQRNDPIPGNHDLAHQTIGKAQRPAHERVLDLLEDPLVSGRRQHGGDLDIGVGSDQLVTGLHAENTKACIAGHVQQGDERSKHRDERAHRQCQPQRALLGLRDRDVLGNHLAHHHVEEDNDGEPPDEPDRVQGRLRYRTA